MKLSHLFALIALCIAVWFLAAIGAVELLRHHLHWID